MNAAVIIRYPNTGGIAGSCVGGEEIGPLAGSADLGGVVLAVGTGQFADDACDRVGNAHVKSFLSRRELAGRSAPKKQLGLTRHAATDVTSKFLHLAGWLDFSIGHAAASMAKSYEMDLIMQDEIGNLHSEHLRQRKIIDFPGYFWMTTQKMQDKC